MAWEDISRTITLDAVVNEALLSIPEDQRTLQKRRFLDFAIRGMRYLSLRVFKNSKRVVKVEPDSNNRIPFPEDMEEFIAISVPVDGKLWRLTRKNDLIPTKTVDGIDESLDAADGEGIEQPTAQGDSFTARGGVNAHGYFTIDERGEEIIINSNNRGEVLLEYISSGVNNTGTTNVPAKYAPAIIAYILWRDVQYDRTANAIIRKEAFDAFNYEIKELKRLTIGNLYEWYDAWNNKSMVR
jgi:hypothetical protein